jgi:hypothetical protein
MAYPNEYKLANAARGLGVDLSNARKPDSGIDREHAVKIIDYMQRNRLPKLYDLVKHLSDKWQKL